jgi:murein DD-endopeptidase MepM/ murein hydrolase activator NlpD
MARKIEFNNITSLFKKPFTLSIFFLVFFILFLISLSIFLTTNSPNYCYEQDAVFKENTSTSPSPPLFFLKTGTYFRDMHHHSVPRQKPSLLLRCLFPSDSLLIFWGYDQPDKQDLSPIVLSENLHPIALEEGAGFGPEIDFHNRLQGLTQVGPQPPGNSLALDQPFFVLSDDLQFGISPKLSNKLLLNPKHPRYCFPVSWPFSFRDSFGDSRGEHRMHIGIDIFAEEGTEVYAVTDGVIHTLAIWEKAGLTLLLRGQDGKGYCYMHLQKFAEGVHEGQMVKKGELIAHVGRTGTKTSPPHLHFQVHTDHNFSKDYVLNPYDALVSLCQGQGVIDLGQSKPRFAKMEEGKRHLFSPKPSGPAVFLVAQKPQPVQQTGLVWSVPQSTWKVSRADVRVPAPKSKTLTSANKLSWSWPKNSTSANKARVLIPHFPSPKE